MNLSQTAVAEHRVALFREALVRVMGEKKTYRLPITDKELSNLTNTPLRSTRRYLKHLVDRGVFEVERKRHFHHSFGWCNERAISLTPTHQLAVLRRNQ